MKAEGRGKLPLAGRLYPRLDLLDFFAVATVNVLPLKNKQSQEKDLLIFFFKKIRESCTKEHQYNIYTYNLIRISRCLRINLLTYPHIKGWNYKEYEKLLEENLTEKDYMDKIS